MNAYKLLKKYENIENILDAIRGCDDMKKKYGISTNFDYPGARTIFKSPVVDEIKPTQLKVQDLQ